MGILSRNIVIEILNYNLSTILWNLDVLRHIDEKK